MSPQAREELISVLVTEATVSVARSPIPRAPGSRPRFQTVPVAGVPASIRLDHQDPGSGSWAQVHDFGAVCPGLFTARLRVKEDVRLRVDMPAAR